MRRPNDCPNDCGTRSHRRRCRADDDRVAACPV